MSQTFVALDLETTGLDPQADAIIEVGAVRFNDEGIIDQFATLVDPGRPIPERIQALTGLAPDELRGAPSLDEVAGRLEAFLGDDPLVGHNAAAFDARFLDAKGIRHSPVIFDTLELASLLLPGLGEYGLAALARRLGIPFPVQHRALADAVTAMELFAILMRRAREMPPSILAQVDRWLASSRWPWRSFFALVREMPAAGPETPFPRPETIPAPLEPTYPPSPVDPHKAMEVLSAAHRLIPEFEERPEQQAMLRAVAQALSDGLQLLVEAGTGTGKSLAYLIPAALYALANGSQVVISTATINLQEQLIGKDIPALQALLTGRDLRAATLKGRRHYLCLRRFTAHQAAGPGNDDEAKLMARLLIWLAQTETGDRAELNLSAAAEALWPRFNAEGADCGANCPFVVQGTCFLWRARRRAEAAHLLVVNHALLLSDVAVAGHLLPPCDNLIVDEAHHLEEETTRQLGFSAGQRDVLDFLERCGALASAVRSGIRGITAVLGPGAHLTGIAAALAEAAQQGKPRLQQLAGVARAFLRQQAEGGTSANGEYDSRLLIDGARRAQPDWSQVEMGWENLRLALARVTGLVENLTQGLTQAQDSGLLNYELLVSDTEALGQQGRLLLDGIAAALAEADPQRIVWLEEDRRDGSMTVAWAPLEVADILRERLYADKNAVVLTGATLAAPGAAGGFEYIRQRLGLDVPLQLLLGSSFDYQRAALVLIPRDMPEPNQPGYLETLARAIADLCRATQGRALALFTAHSTLRATLAPVRAALERDGIAVLGQDIDGTPQQLLRSLRSNPRSVILGTASFWEGVDVAGEALSLLIIARLPFSVPTEPVFAARAALYDDPFAQYALPQAVLRFKQGFGRLIRSRSDRGVAAILDRRVLSKGYGGAFLAALPSCPVRRAMIEELPQLAVGWLTGNYKEG